MKIFLITLGITCLTIILVSLLVNYCRRRLAKTPHGLSGMCQRTGSEICSSCAEVAGSEGDGQDKGKETG